jgi:Flp pilus assembly protein TadD
MDHGLVPQVALYRAGKIDEAEASYRRALDAGDNSAYSMLAQLLVETGRSQEAEVVYQKPSLMALKNS